MTKLCNFRHKLLKICCVRGNFHLCVLKDSHLELICSMKILLYRTIVTDDRSLSQSVCVIAKRYE